MITALLLSVATLQEGGWTPPPPPPLIPSPRAAQPRFAPFVLPDAARIVATEDGLERQAKLLQDTLEKRLGRRIPIGERPARSGDLTLTLGYLADDVAENPEAYSIEVFADHVALSGNNAAGVARAVARLAQLFQYNGEAAAWMLPPTRIDDAPAFPWRGLMLDLARFPHSVESVRESIDLAFLFSLNIVHLHLSDDQAFTFPATCLPPRTDPGAPGPHRGYSLEDLRSLVQYAADRGITLVPEIDMPAHSSVLIRARPDLFGAIDKETGEAVPTRAVNMASQDAVNAMKGLVDEVRAVFTTSPYFHIGGDEVYAPGLLKLPEYAALAAAEGLPGPEEPGAINVLLNHFLQGMSEHLIEADLQPIVWEGFRPAGEKSLGTKTWVMSWNQHSQTPEALEAAGYTLINCGWEPLYIVPAQSWASQAEDAFAWEPRSVRQRFGGRTAEVGAEASFRGSQICVWEQRPEAVVPAVLALAPELSERLWGSYSTPEAYAEFRPLADATQTLVRDMLRPVQVTWKSDLGAGSLVFSEKVAVQLSVGPHAAPGTIRYVVGDDFGLEPTAGSPAMGEKPLELKKTSVVAAALFAPDGRRIGGVTQVRFEKGTPALAFAAYRLPQGGTFTPEAFDALDDGALIGRGRLMLTTPERLAAINREQFAKVRPEAHIDLRPLDWGSFGPAGARMELARPRLYGRHAVVAEGRIHIDEPGEWSLEFKSRGGIGRIHLDNAVATCGPDNQPTKRTAKLEAGTYRLRIEHAMVEVHDDLQVWLYRTESETRTPLRDVLMPLADFRPGVDLRKLDGFQE